MKGYLVVDNRTGKYRNKDNILQDFPYVWDEQPEYYRGCTLALCELSFTLPPRWTPTTLELIITSMNPVEAVTYVVRQWTLGLLRQTEHGWEQLK